MIASNVFCVPHVVVKYVCFVGKRATVMPMNSNWFNLVFFFLYLMYSLPLTGGINIYIYIYYARIFT